MRLFNLSVAKVLYILGGVTLTNKRTHCCTGSEVVKKHSHLGLFDPHNPSGVFSALGVQPLELVSIPVPFLCTQGPVAFTCPFEIGSDHVGCFGQESVSGGNT